MTTTPSTTGAENVTDFLPTPPVCLLSSDEVRSELKELADLLKACVEDGAGIGFLLPFSTAEAEKFWSSRLPSLEQEQSFLMIAREGEEIAGVVMLALASQDNGRHRADVAKLMVHPTHRRKGIARKLMSAIDGLALSKGRWLLVLDTVTGDRAENLYPTCGYEKVGIIPDYAYGSHGSLDATTVFYKDLRPVSARSI